MPATFPSHAAAVLPLKFWKPHWFDGIALTIGSAAPDFAYAFDGTWFEAPVPDWPPLYAIAHSWYGVVLWGVPVTLAACWLTRRTFSLNRPAVWVTAASAVIGATSHVVWDRLSPNDLASSIIGALIAVPLLMLHFGRNWPKPHWPTLIAGAVGLPFLPGAALAHTTGSRIVLLAGLSLLIGRRVRTRL